MQVHLTVAHLSGCLSACLSLPVKFYGGLGHVGRRFYFNHFVSSSHRDQMDTEGLWETIAGTCHRPHGWDGGEPLSGRAQEELTQPRKRLRSTIHTVALGRWFSVHRPDDLSATPRARVKKPDSEAQVCTIPVCSFKMEGGSKGIVGKLVSSWSSLAGMNRAVEIKRKQLVITRGL